MYIFIYFPFAVSAVYLSALLTDASAY